jgi:predicted aminopeptidase
VVYDSDVGVEEKRRRKRDILDALSADADRLFAQTGVGASPLAAPLNNARLVSLGLYESWAPAFKSMFAECGERLDCFYERAGKVAALPPDERSARLALLSMRPEQVARTPD